MTRRRCAVLGSPVAHSLSPRLHQAAYGWLGLDWVYERHDVVPAGLADFVAGLDGSWRGLSCTMPLKAAILALGAPDPVAAALGVANTVVFDGTPSDPATTRVYNTDVSGFAAAWAGLDVTTALVAGTGATAASALYALAGAGTRSVQLVGRNPERRAALADQARGWGLAVAERSFAEAWEPAALAISTVPAEVAAVFGDRIAAAQAVFDVLYDPWPTPLAARAQALGRSVLTGRDLLCSQAVGQIELMTGASVPVAVLKAALA